MAITMIENTIDAAPRSPAKETSAHCLILHLNGNKIRNTATGLATKVKKIMIARAGHKTCEKRWGNASRPSRKKINICASPVRPSKNDTMTTLLRILLFPTRMPIRYTLKKALPPIICVTPKQQSTAPIIKMVSSPSATSFVFFNMYITINAMTRPIATPKAICFVIMIPMLTLAAAICVPASI